MVKILNRGQAVEEIYQKKYSFWKKLRETNALNLFRLAAKKVPAYVDFLKKEKINPDKIKTFADFEFIPPVSKDNYLRKYPMEQLVWEGSLGKPLIFTATSGSTGKSFYFPRTHYLDHQYSILAELFLRSSSHQNQGPVLLVVCFGMGIWIGGVFTYQAFEIAGRELKYPLSVITPGINKQEVINTLTNISPHFKQTILAGYPPFLNDILDQAIHDNVDLKSLNIRLFSAAEPFTEAYRDHLAESAHIKDVCKDTLNIYGTADIGAMAWESPTAILGRRLAVENKPLFQSIFGTITKTPTLAQYNPRYMTFEAPNGNILLTGNNAMPLIRYAVGDNGGVFGFDAFVDFYKNHGIDFLQKAKDLNLEKFIYQLPFVYVYERSDFSVVLSGANIYPEEIRHAVQDKSFAKQLSGKFTMLIKNDKKFHEYLEINVELKIGSKKSKTLESKLRQKIVEHLLESNSEYKAIYTGKISGVIPKIIFWPHNHDLYFKSGVKQKWVKK
jgi:phenylacetate-CoA ligase